jgi:FtsP/CotA-like multicopper oxidase with cupredoxin domain
MPLEPKWYHFRFLNVATSRPFLVKFKNEYGRDVGPEICRVIASDGGYRPDPIAFPPEGLQMGIAERYEVVCNFASYAGRKLYLW